METKTKKKRGTGLIVAGIAGMALGLGTRLYTGHFANEARTPEVSNVLQLEAEVNRLSALPLSETIQHPNIGLEYAELRRQYNALTAEPDVKAAMDNYYAKGKTGDYLLSGFAGSGFALLTIGMAVRNRAKKEEE